MIQGLTQNPKDKNQGFQPLDFSRGFKEEDKENNMLMSNISEIPSHELQGKMVSQGRYEQKGVFMEEKNGYNIREYQHMRNRLQSSLSRSKSRDSRELLNSPIGSEDQKGILYALSMAKDSCNPKFLSKQHSEMNFSLKSPSAAHGKLVSSSPNKTKVDRKLLKEIAGIDEEISNIKKLLAENSLDDFPGKT